MAGEKRQHGHDKNEKQREPLHSDRTHDHNTRHAGIGGGIVGVDPDPVNLTPVQMAVISDDTKTAGRRRSGAAGGYSSAVG